MLWYAVPFVGKNAKAAARFKDKSLRFDERLGTYVLDPRYPEVRQYLIDIYRAPSATGGSTASSSTSSSASPPTTSTVLEAEDGRDYASVNEATDRMMTDVMARAAQDEAGRDDRVPPAVHRPAHPQVRQHVPRQRLPRTTTSRNRVKTVDLRLLSGKTAVHADMVMWHPDEPRRERRVPAEQRAVLGAAGLGEARGEIAGASRDDPVLPRLLEGEPRPAHRRQARGVPADANYPMVIGYDAEKQIVGLYDDLVVRLDAHRPRGKIDVVNGKSTTSVTLSAPSDLGTYRYTVTDCRGRVVRRGNVRLSAGLHELEVPVSGIVELLRR